ncbi:MAG: ferritin-like domain-containing protein [Gaiellales bacterium]
MKLTSLHDVFVEQLADLLSAERQLLEALPNVAAAASTPDLLDAIDEHLHETREHVARLERVFELANVPATDEECEAMKGLIREVQEVVEADGDPLARDVALIASAQRVEHYEIAAYGTARELARQLDLDEVVLILEDTLSEENAADQRLTRIATGGLFTGGLNQKATAASSSEPARAAYDVP